LYKGKNKKQDKKEDIVVRWRKLTGENKKMIYKETERRSSVEYGGEYQLSRDRIENIIKSVAVNIVGQSKSCILQNNDT